MARPDAPHLLPDAPLRLTTMAQLSRSQGWRLQLQHSRPYDLFIWTTRGQGRMHLAGRRRGLGVHNAIFIPAGSMFALDIGKQGFAQVVTTPAGALPGMPDAPALLRVRDALAQNELAGVLDALHREQNAARPLADEAARANGLLLSIWFRRAVTTGTGDPEAQSAAERLTAAFAVLAEHGFRSGHPMAYYAEALEVTPTHLTRVCQQCAGISAADILTERSLHAAREALEDTETPVQDIAEALGFSSPAYFSRFIQTHTGAAPTDLRSSRAA